MQRCIERFMRVFDTGEPTRHQAATHLLSTYLKDAQQLKREVAYATPNKRRTIRHDTRRLLTM